VSVYFEEHVVTHDFLGDTNDDDKVIHLIDLETDTSLCGAKGRNHDPNCPGFLEPWEDDEEVCYCGLKICPDCIFIHNLDKEMDGY
jgi:hypothetical protein